MYFTTLLPSSKPSHRLTVTINAVSLDREFDQFQIRVPCTGLEKDFHLGKIYLENLMSTFTALHRGWPAATRSQDSHFLQLHEVGVEPRYSPPRHPSPQRYCLNTSRAIEVTYRKSCPEDYSTVQYRNLLPNVMVLP
jgi:hypothetical protein